MTIQNPSKRYAPEPIVNKGELPDPFAIPGGDSVTAREEWSACSRAWRDMILDMEYGGLPPKPSSLEIETLCHSDVRHWPGAPNLWSYCVHCHSGEQSLAFCVRILFSSTTGPFPAIINGDGCWWYISDDVAQRVVDSGCALVMFNRTEMAKDLGYADVPEKNERSE